MGILDPINGLKDSNIFHSVDAQGNRVKISALEREKTLVCAVRNALKNAPQSIEDLIQVMYLFYDGHDATNIKLERVVPQQI